MLTQDQLIHKPRLMQSNLPNQEGNRITQRVVSDHEIITTEYWEKEPTREWCDAGVYTAKKGYTWVTKWTVGKNYIVTKTLDENNSLVGFYYDMSSPVTRIGSNFQAYDWYLDIFKISDGRTVLLDEDELELAIKAGFITNTQSATIKEAARIIIHESHIEI